MIIEIREMTDKLRIEARLGITRAKIGKNRGEGVNDSGTGRNMHNAQEIGMAGNF